jgi:hypothetical protein
LSYKEKNIHQLKKRKKETKTQKERQKTRKCILDLHLKSKPVNTVKCPEGGKDNHMNNVEFTVTMVMKMIVMMDGDYDNA